MIKMVDFQKEHRTLRFSIHSQSAADIDSDLTIALEAVVLKAGPDVAVVYSFCAESGELRAIARQTNIPASLPDYDAILSRAASQRLDGLKEPIQGKPSRDVFLKELPEAIQYNLQSCLVAPISGVEGMLGILTLGRVQCSEFSAPAIEVAQRSARLMAAVLERDSLQQKLLERKLLESAKGILQARRRLSERQAYSLLRNESRRRRVSMVELAREIIDSQFRRPALRPPREPKEPPD